MPCCLIRATLYFFFEEEFSRLFFWAEHPGGEWAERIKKNFKKQETRDLSVCGVNGYAESSYDFQWQKTGQLHNTV